MASHYIPLDWLFVLIKIKQNIIKVFTTSLNSTPFLFNFEKKLSIELSYLIKLLIVFFLCYCSERAFEAMRLSGLIMYSKIVRFSPSISTCAIMPGSMLGLIGDFENVEPMVLIHAS